MLSVGVRAPGGSTGIAVALALERRIELALERRQHRRHVAHGAVAQERHRAVRDAPLGLDLAPPDAAVADADAVDVERLGDDHVVDAGLGEPAALGQPGDAAVAAGLLVAGAGDLDRAGQRRAAVDQRLGRDDGGGEARPSCRRSPRP